MKGLITIGAAFLIHISMHAADTAAQEFENMLDEIRWGNVSIENHLKLLPSEIISSDAYLQEMLIKAQDNVRKVHVIKMSQSYTPALKQILKCVKADQDNCLRGLQCRLSANMFTKDRRDNGVK